MRILIIEDDNKMRAMLQSALESCYTIDAVGSLEAAFELIGSFEYEALLLDRNLGGEDKGITIIPRLKRLQPSCAVIIASAYGGVEERIAGLSAGADDYLEKPYDLRELKIRLDAIVHRYAPEQIAYGELCIDVKHGKVWYQKSLLALSKKEHDLLFFLASHPEKIFTREDIANAIYNDPSATSSNTIDVIIKNIRKKLTINPIETYKGRGYALTNT